MKKLAIALAGALFLTAATPVFACPGHEDNAEQAPKTADKAKDQDKTKTDTAKTQDKAKDKDAGKKKPDAPKTTPAKV